MGFRCNVTVDTTEHDNWVYLAPSSGWTPSLAFELDDHSITSGQPWGGVSTDVSRSGIGNRREGWSPRIKQRCKLVPLTCLSRLVRKLAE